MVTMELSLRLLPPPSPPPSSWNLQREARARVRLTVKKVGFGCSAPPYRPLLPPRCSSSSTEGEKERILRTTKEDAVDTVSWLQRNKGKDAFLGWESSSSSSSSSSPSPSSSSSNDSSSSSQARPLLHNWIKIGGGIILALGFSLGSYTIYKGKEAARDFSLPPPAIEQIIDASEVFEKVVSPENFDGKNDIIEESNQNESVLKKVETGPQTNDVDVEILHQENNSPVVLPATLGKIVVPASSDHMQEQILAALQALKVIEAGTEAGSICTKREYARWLIAGSAILARSPSHKIFPAMYIEGVSKLAYDDVLPEDPDFPCIQGLAEAGLISSKLDDGNESCFSPDSPLTREDLVTWKAALEMKPDFTSDAACQAEKRTLQAASGFIDIDKIRQEAWPALLADVKAGERSIIALAFGFTRRFQPKKHVTKAQAAVAVASGESWELVAEELSRLEAESIAEAAIVADLALEMKAQQEVAAAFNELLQLGREKHQEAKSTIETLKVELEQVKLEKEEEKFAFLRERAALNSERDFLLNLKCEMEEKSLALSGAKLEIVFEKEEVDKLRAEAEEEKEKISKIRSDLEIERNALTLAREWADEEAKKALAHSKLLQKVRQRWEDGGVEVRVHKDLDEMNIPGPSWNYSKEYQARESSLNGFVEMLKDLTQLLADVALRFMNFIQHSLQSIKQGSIEIGGSVHESFHSGSVKCEETMRGAVEIIRQRVEEITLRFTEASSKLADQWKGGAEKLSQKLKIT